MISSVKLQTCSFAHSIKKHICTLRKIIPMAKFVNHYKITSETRAKCASNIFARKLDRTEQSSAINIICSYLYTITLCSWNVGE